MQIFTNDIIDIEKIRVRSQRDLKQRLIIILLSFQKDLEQRLNEVLSDFKFRLNEVSLRFEIQIMQSFLKILNSN